MAYATKYRFQEGCLDGITRTWLIKENNYVGVITDIIGSAAPVVGSMDKSGDDRFVMLKPISISLEIFVPTRGDYDEFYDITNFQYKIEEQESGSTVATYWVNDDVFQEEYADGKYFVRLTGTDGMSILKGRRTVLSGRQTHLTIIRECLNAIGFGLNIVDAIRITEAGHAAGGPLNQTKYNTTQFTKDKGERWFLSDILEDTLRTYGAQLFQRGNKWVIANVESQYAGLSGYEYTSAGAYVGEWSLNSNKQISNTPGSGNLVLLPGGLITKQKGRRELSVHTTYGKVLSAIIPNGDFNNHPGYSAGDYYSGSQSSTLLLTDWETDPALLLPHTVIEIRNHDQTGDYVYLKRPSIFDDDPLWIRNKLDNAVALDADLTGEYVFSLLYAPVQSQFLGIIDKVTVKIKVEAIDGGSTQYLNFETSSWQAGEYIAEYEGVSCQLEETLHWYLVEVVTTGFPGGKIRVTLNCYLDNVLNLLYTGMCYDSVQFYSRQAKSIPATGKLTGYTDLDYTEVPEDLEFQQVDAPYTDLGSNSGLFYKNYLSLTDDTPTSAWVSDAYAGTLAAICLYAQLEAYGRSVQIKNFSYYGTVRPGDVVVDENSKRFQIISFSQDYKINQGKLECVEIIEPGTIEITTNFSYDSSSGGPGSENGETDPENQTQAGADDRYVSRMGKYSAETGPPARLADRYFAIDLYSETMVYHPVMVGYGLWDSANDYREVLAGSYPTVGTGSVDSWVETDRCFVVGNGENSGDLSDALTVYKSGYIVSSNAYVFGAYSHGLLDPEVGSVQYATGYLQLYTNGAWYPLAYYADLIHYFVDLYDTPYYYHTQHALISTASGIAYSPRHGANNGYFWVSKACPDSLHHDELITNGDFDDGSDGLDGWSGTSGWEVVDGACVHEPGDTTALYQAIGEPNGGIKHLTFQVTISAGTLTVELSDPTSESYTLNRTQTFDGYFNCEDGTMNILFTPSVDFDGSIDEISLMVVTATDQEYQIIGFNSDYTQSAFNVRWDRESFYIGRGVGTASGGDPLGDDNVVATIDGLGGLTTGAQITGIGAGIGATVTDESNLILIGTNADIPAVATSNWLNIGDLIQGDLSGLSTYLSGGLQLHCATPANTVVFPAGVDHDTIVGNTLVMGADGQLAWTSLTGALDLQNVTDNGATTTNVISTAGYQVSGTALYSEHLTDVAALTTGYLPYKAADGLDDSIIQQLLGTEIIQVSTYKSTAGAGYNIFVGGGGQSNEGTANSAFGYYSLYANTTGVNNSAFGYYSLYSNSTGKYNSAFGYASLHFNTTGTHNSAFGYYSLRYNTTGARNSAFGYASLYANTTGTYNSAFGDNAGRSNTTGARNSAFGYASLYANTTGTYNSAFGSASLFSNTTGINNSAFGDNAGRYITAGGNNATSSNSVYLGYDTRAKADADQNEIVIGYTAIGNGSNTATIGNSSLLETYLTGIRLKAGTATNAPQKKTAGTLLATPEDGAEEYDGTRFYQTPSSATRQTVAWLSDDLAVFASGAATVGQVPMADGSGGVDWGNQFSVSGTQYRVAMFATASTLGDSILTTNGTDTKTLLISTKGTNNNYCGGGGQFTTSGNQNTSFGYQSLLQLTEGTYNTAIGRAALYSCGVGDLNTALGTQALYSCRSGSNNIAVGTMALNDNTTGDNNVAVGKSAAYNTTIDNTVAVGYQALFSNETGTGNTAIGHLSLMSITASGNTAVGYLAGYSIADANPNNTSSNSVYLGYDTRAKSDGDANEIVIGYAAIGHGSNTCTIGNSSITDNYFTGNLITTGALKLLESSGATYYTILQAGDQSANLTYTLPTAAPAANGYALTATTAGVMSWAEIASQWTSDTYGITYTAGNVGIGAASISGTVLKIAATGNQVGIWSAGSGTGAGVSASSVTGYGVYGISSSGGMGVYGYSASGNGVRGTSSTSTGVYCMSTSGYGMYGVSNSNYSGYFSGGLGVYITASTTNLLTLGDVASVDISGNADFNSLLIGGTTSIDSNGFFKPVSSADASAPNNSIYYSTDASKLVYKDSGGNVNALY